MINKKLLELLEVCLAFNLTIKVNPEQKQVVVSFKHVGMAGIKVIPFTINGNVTSFEVDLVRDVISMITAGDSIIDIEKRINEFVPF